MSSTKRNFRDISKERILKCPRLMVRPRKLRITISVDGVTTVPGVPLDAVISSVVSCVDADDVPIYADVIHGVPMDAVISSIENANVPANADVHRVSDYAPAPIIDEDPDVPDKSEDPKVNKHDLNKHVEPDEAENAKSEDHKAPKPAGWSDQVHLSIARRTV